MGIAQLIDIKHREELISQSYITDWDVNSLYPEPTIPADIIAPVGRMSFPDLRKPISEYDPATRYAMKIALSTAYGHIATRYRFTGKLTRKTRRLNAQLKRRDKQNKIKTWRDRKRFWYVARKSQLRGW